MKVYDQNQMTGYSLTHPRGWKRSFMGAYYCMIKNRKVSYIRMHRTMHGGYVPSLGNRTQVYITYHTNAITLEKQNGIRFKKIFLMHDYYNLKNRNHITIETNLYCSTYYGLDLGISYHLNGKGRLWCIERDLEVKL